MGEAAGIVTAVILLIAGASTENAAERFDALGFLSQVVAEGTLIISGPEMLFEERFQTQILYTPGGIRAFSPGSAEVVSSLDADRLGADFGDIAAIGFETPLDFGPGAFDSQFTQEATMTTISAAVLLKPGSDQQRLRAGFARLGFDVQAIGADTLLLTGDAALFETAFSTAVNMDNGPTVGGMDSERMLPLSALPDDMGADIDRIEFEAPPDFGPTNY